MDRRMRDLLYFNNDVPRSLPRKFQDILKMPTFEYILCVCVQRDLLYERPTFVSADRIRVQEPMGQHDLGGPQRLVGYSRWPELAQPAVARLCHQGFPSQITYRMLRSCLLFSLPTCRPNSTVPISHSCAWPSSVCPRHQRHFGTLLRRTWGDCARANAKLTHIPSLIDRKEMMGEPRPLTDFHRFVHNLDFGRGTRAFPGTNKLPNQYLLVLNVIH